MSDKVTFFSDGHEVCTTLKFTYLGQERVDLAEFTIEYPDSITLTSVQTSQGELHSGTWTVLSLLPGMTYVITLCYTLNVDDCEQVELPLKFGLSSEYEGVPELCIYESGITCCDIEACLEDSGAVMEVDTSTALMQFVIDEDTMSSNTDTKVPTQQSVKAYVDNSVAGGVTFIGQYNAATNTPDLDVSPSGILKGYQYQVSADGVFFTANVEAGDIITSTVDNPTLESDWTIVNKNIELPNNNQEIAFGDGIGLTTSSDLTWDDAGKELTVDGKLTVTGLIDPTGMEFAPVVANPGGVAANTIWIDSGTSELEYGSETILTEVNVSSNLGSVDTDDISEGATNLYYTEGRVSANVSVVANTAKVSADGSVTTHNDVTSAGSGDIITVAERNKLSGIEALADVTDETNVVAALDGATLTGATVAAGDKVLIQDVDDTNNLKTVSAQSLADLGVDSLADLIDVSSASPTLGNILIASGATYTGRAFVEGDIAFSDITTGNADITKHGFAPKLPGTSSQYLDGDGNWSTPSGTPNAYTSVSFGPAISVNVNHNFGAYPIVQIIISDDVHVPLNIKHNTINDFTVTFTSNQSGTIIATLGNPQLNNYTSPAGNYNVDVEDYIVNAIGTGSTITLPTSVGIESKKFLIKNSSSGNITVDTTSSQTMDGDLTIILTPLEALEVVSNGANYLII